MAVYRFKVCLEDNEDIVRDIDIKAAQTFEQFHAAIQEAFKFDAKHAASFFVSDDYWRKGQEITLNKEDLPLEAGEIKKGVDPKKLMSETRIARFIEQPHQRFVYVFDPIVQWTFLVEMLKISEESNKTNYPATVKSRGTAPKQYKQAGIIKEELSDPLLMALQAQTSDEEDEEIYKTIETETNKEGIEDDDIDSLEGEEGEENEEGEEADEMLNDDEEGSYGFKEEEER